MRRNFTCANSRAFTLAELLTAVLVISVIMVALAPVITKRMKDTVSVQTDNKKGLEIFTNPGTYTFDVPIGINTLFIQGSGGGGGGAGATKINPSKVNITTSQTWKVPKGVNKVTIKITGSGGGGGGGYGRNATESCKSNTTLFTYLSDANKDMCISKPQIPTNAANWGTVTTVSGSSLCTASECCWKEINSVTCSASPSGGISGCKRTVCTYHAAKTWCTGEPNKTTFADTIGLTRKGRLITKSEMERILKRNRLGAGGMDVCKIPQTKSATYNISKCAVCNMTGQGGANGSENSYGYPSLTWLNEKYALSLWENVKIDNPAPAASAYGVFCAYDLNNWYQYSGAGGASGAIIERTINVLPNDDFIITIGSGGAGGLAANSGSKGGTTKVVHKRGGIELGTYYAQGGLGGKAATSTSNGSAYTDGTDSTQTTPPGTCYAKHRTTTNGSFIGGNTTCSVISYSGEDGSEISGGSGGATPDVSISAEGGKIDNGDGGNGLGYNATVSGGGGGGGTCARGIRTPSSCSKGGKGGGGKVEISFQIYIPGAGGGAASRVGGKNTENLDYEIKYTVQEGSRIVFEVGAGGVGGSEGLDGTNGSPTTVNGNKIIFLGGESGKTLTQAQRSNIDNCVLNSSTTTEINNCTNNSVYKPTGGRSGIIGIDNTITNNQQGIIYDASKISFSILSNSYKGQNGKSPSQVSQDIVPWNYSFDGGVGGSPFGIMQNSIALSVICGGGILGTYGNNTNASTYICTSGSPKGNTARSHDPVNNEFGGSGGGGGGVVGDSFEQGSGGNRRRSSR